MPFPPTSRIPPGPRRRSLLAVGSTALLLAGCSAGSEESDGGTDGSLSAADRARERAARDSEGLVARYDAVIAVHPGLAERLRPLREEVVRHAEAFGEVGKTSPTGSGASPSVSPPAAVPGNEKDALSGLTAAERDLADRRAKELLGVPGELARLLASVAAAGAGHVYLLTEGAR